MAEAREPGTKQAREMKEFEKVVSKQHMLETWCSKELGVLYDKLEVQQSALIRGMLYTCNTTSRDVLN